MRIEEVRERWLTRREELARLDAHVDGVRIIDQFVADLEAIEQDEADEILSLTRAADLSGYSSEHLARCIRQGRIPNAGRRNKPMIRRGDLPRKAKDQLARTLNTSYDPDADARGILSRWGDR